MLNQMKRIKGIIDEVIEDREIMKDDRLYIQKYKQFNIGDLEFILKENLEGEEYISLYKRHSSNEEHEAPAVKGEYLLKGAMPKENKFYFTLTTPKYSEDQLFLVDYYFLIELEEDGYKVAVEDVKPGIFA